MKTILVPVGGATSDEIVIHTAMAVAQPLAAHLRFLHVRVPAGEAALHTPHVEFARGAAMGNALAHLETEAQTRSVRAGRVVTEICGRHGIAMADQPCVTNAVTGSWHEEDGAALDRLLFHARHSDLTIMARARRSDGLPVDRLETLLINAGRPLMVASQTIPTALTSTIMVCWKETAEAARALTASMPMLCKAERVLFVGVNEGSEDVAPAMQDIVTQVRWNGVNSDMQVVAGGRGSTPELLLAAAKDCGADLMVMGGYGHSRAREFIFGGCTRAIIENSDLPVLLMH